MNSRTVIEEVGARAGFLLSGLGALLLLLALTQPWLQVPLVGGWSAFRIPVALGWGVQSPAISYGLLCVLLASIFLARILADGIWPGIRWHSDSRPPPLTGRIAARMGLVATAVSLMFVFQFVVADFQLVTTLQDSENQAVLVRRHVSHVLPRQHLAVRSFHIDTADPGDRWRLLIMVGGPGLLLPLAAGASLLYGAFLLRRRPPEDPSPTTSPATRPRARFRRVAALGGALAVLIVLARAPAALVYTYAAQAALQGGDNHGALALAQTAQAWNQSLALLPTLHLTRGEALYHLGQDSGEEVNLFLAAHNRAIGLYTLAWQQDAAIMRSAPNDPVIRHDMAVTLEMLAESRSPVKLTPADADTARKSSLTPLQIKIVERALPWLDRLLVLQSDNLYAHYLRGRILFTAHAYDAASLDFASALSLTTDGNMRSEAYTYLAFCRGGLQDYAGQRSLLQAAVRLDTGYYNAVAHQALSGLH